MEYLEERIRQAREVIEKSEYILIGGGAGLSTAAGLTYDGKRFTDNFSDFMEKYGFIDMYSGTFYPFEHMTYKNSNATLIRFNKVYPLGSTEIAKRTISFDEDIMQMIQYIKNK